MKFGEPTGSLSFEAAMSGNLWHIQVSVDGEHVGLLLMSPRQYQTWRRMLGSKECLQSEDSR